MLVRVARTATAGALRNRRSHTTALRSLLSLVKRCGVHRRGYCTKTSSSLCSSQSPTKVLFAANTDTFVSPTRESTTAFSTHENIKDTTTRRQEFAPHGSNGTKNNADAQNVAEIVKQLQELAAGRCHQLSKEIPILSHHRTEAALLADNSSNDRTLPINTVLGSNGSTSKHFAWKVGFQLAEDAAWSTEVTEWLLFLCLRSQNAVSGSPAPLEVCEGIYQTLRQRRAAATAKTQNSTTATVGKCGLGVSYRSPFEPKGVHHHYAVWLLKEFYSSQRVLNEMIVDAVSSETVLDADGADKTKHKNHGVGALTEVHKAEAVHRAYFVLQRALEVLLIELPKDEAAVFPVPDAASSGRHRRHRASSTLRPTTALLILEVSRKLAQLVAQQHLLNLSVPDCTAAFSLLSFLTTPSAFVNGQVSDARSSLENVTPLAAVAREAFELVMCTASPLHKNTTAGSAKSHALQDDAVMLYLGFLVASSPSHTLAFDEMDCFVRKGSLTACQLSGQKGEHGVDNASQSDLDVSHLEDHMTEAVATAVRVLLSSYATGNDPAKQVKSTVPSYKQRARRQGAMDAFGCLLLQPVPVALRSVFTLQNVEQSTAEQPYTSIRSNKNTDGAQAKKYTRPVSWCAWLLRVLLCDLERSWQMSTAQLARNLYNINNTVLLQNNDEADGKDSWQLQSEWVILMVTRLMTQLRQQNLFASLPSPHRQVRSAGTAARRPLQEVWRLVFQAALQGFFYHASLTDNIAPASSSQSLRSLKRQAHTTFNVGGAAASGPSILLQLCYPYYDKTQWRGPSVNLYVRLLDQWGEGEHIRQVFAAVARREGDFQAEVQAAVAAERAAAINVEDAHGESMEQNEASTKRDNHVFRRYRPALNLHSCVTTLKYCGCPPRILETLTVVDEAQPQHRSLAAHDDLREDGDDTLPPDTSFRRSSSQMASDARLAGEVLKYMLCSLHVVERNLMRIAFSTASADLPVTKDSKEEETEEDVPHTLTTEGYPIERWVEWVGACCVPAVEHLYRNAGLEKEWIALGY